MRRSLLAVTGLAALPMLSLGGSAMATPIEDPALNESMNLSNTCPANCASVVLAQDPFAGGKKTVEYILNATVPNVLAGDLKVTEFGSGTVGDLLRFEDITLPSGANEAVIFLYSYDAGPYDADVGPPSSYQALTGTIAENSAGFTGVYVPTAGEPGYCVTPGATSCRNVGYGLTSADVPEPMTLSLFGFGLAGIVTLRRRRKGAARSDLL